MTTRLTPTAGIAGAMLAAVLIATPSSSARAHVHSVDTEHHVQPLANGQNHPGFGAPDENGLRLSCDGILEPANAGPAGYGLETAHHGPDAGEPGKGDGCYGVISPTLPPPDRNPAID